MGPVSVNSLWFPIKWFNLTIRKSLHLCCTVPFNSSTLFSVSIRNAMPDFGSEVMAEALAQRALVKPVYTIPIIPLSNSNQYRHQDHLDMKDYKKVRPFTFTTHWLPSSKHWLPSNNVSNRMESDFLSLEECGRWNRTSAEVSENVIDLTFVLHLSRFIQWQWLK